MSLEQALQDNTAALKKVAELLEISNADRQKLIASAGAGTGSTLSNAGSDDEMTVAQIKDAAKSADLATLEKMLADEQGGKNRATAVKAIEEAIAAAKPEDEGKSASADTAASSDQATTQANTQNESSSGQTATNSASPSNKNAQPVPENITGEQASSAFGGWFGETDDEGERGKRREFVAQIVEKLGNRISELDNDGRRKAIFFLRRKRAGITVDFDAAYDFNGSPTQEVKAAASAADDLL